MVHLHFKNMSKSLLKTAVILGVTLNGVQASAECDARGTVGVNSDTTVKNTAAHYQNEQVTVDGDYRNDYPGDYSETIWRGADKGQGGASYKQFFRIATKDAATISSATIKYWPQTDYTDKFNHSALRVFYSTTEVTDITSVSGYGQTPTEFDGQCSGSWTLNPDADTYDDGNGGGWVNSDKANYPIHENYINTVSDASSAADNPYWWQYTCDPGTDFKYIYLMGPAEDHRYFNIAEIEMTSSDICSSGGGASSCDAAWTYDATTCATLKSDYDGAGCNSKVSSSSDTEQVGSTGKTCYEHRLEYNCRQCCSQ